MNEKSTQEQISRSTDTLMRIDKTRENLARMLDSIIDMLHEQGHDEDKQLQVFDKYLEGQKIELHQVQSSVEASLIQLIEMVAELRTARDTEENVRPANVDGGWLGHLYGQLLASGTTSAMTGAVVFIATKWGYATLKR